MKKVFSILLAVAMLFSVLTVGSLAAPLDDAVIAVHFEPLATSYKAGDTATFIVSYETKDYIEGGMHACTFEIGFDSDVFEPLESVPATGLYFNAFGTTPASVVLTGYMLDGKVLPTGSFVQVNNRVGAKDTAKGWDSVLKVVMGPDLSAGFTPCHTKTAAFAINLKIKDTAPADGTYSIGLTDKGISEGITSIYLQEFEGLDYEISGSSAADWEFTDVTNVFNSVETPVTIAAAAPEVVHAGQQSKWNGGNANNTAENYLFSFVGKFTGIDVATTKETVDGVERNQVTNIESITAVATYSKTGATVECDTIYTIWEDGDGYKFRAVFRGFAPSDDSTMTVKFVVAMKDGTVYTESPYESVELTRAISDIYNASVNANTGFPAVKA